jgi:hypothetical protein
VSLSRRRFLTTAATASGAILNSPHAAAAPYRASLERDGGTADAGPERPFPHDDTSTRPLVIPATMPMGSGALLGGIGTGFEMRTTETGDGAA